jgi:hypothetical protein
LLSATGHYDWFDGQHLFLFFCQVIGHASERMIGNDKMAVSGSVWSEHCFVTSVNKNTHIHTFGAGASAYFMQEVMAKYI